MKSRLYLLFVILGLGVLTVDAQSDDITGTWNGKLQFPGQSLRLVIHLDQAPDGEWSATLDSPDQGATGIEADEVTVRNDSLQFSIERIGASYRGKKVDGKFTGTFSQAGMSLPLELGREEVAGPPRPQVPQPPLPYRQDSMTFLSPADSIQMAGTLTRPEGPGPFPAAILISGSGPQDRDESLMGHKPFLILADYLTREGYAVLRYDDRGFGASEGNYPEATSQDFANDAQAAIDYLQEVEGIDPYGIGIIGHSEGALIGSMVAADRKDVAFLILLAGPGVVGREILTSQEAAMLQVMGLPAATLTRWGDVRETIYELVVATEQVGDFRDTVQTQAETILAPLTAQDMALLEVQEDNLAERFIILGSPWFRFFLNLDPAEYLQEVTCPVLAINGSKDLQVLPDLNLAAMEVALEAGGNPDYTIRKLEGLNHLFQPAETGLPMEYAQIETTFSPKALQVIGDWLDR